MSVIRFITAELLGQAVIIVVFFIKKINLFFLSSTIKGLKYHCRMFFPDFAFNEEKVVYCREDIPQVKCFIN